MKYYQVFFILFITSLLFSAEFKKDPRDLLARKWVMTSMKVEDKNYSEAMLERQRQQGLVTILQFTKGGTCNVYIKTPKGRTTKRNRWQFANEAQQLVIQTEGGESQVFDIVKLSAKKMTLSLNDNGTTQIFHYKSIK